MQETYQIIVVTTKRDQSAYSGLMFSKKKAEKMKVNM